LSDTISGFEKIMNGDLDHISEEYFMYKWSIQDVLETYDTNKDNEKKII
jgi:F0F1-type ATP synthase beta subunit